MERHRKGRLETSLNGVMVAVVQTALQIVRPHRLEREAQERAWKEQARRDGIERHRREILKKALDEWRYVHSLDEFLAALRPAMLKAGVELEGRSPEAVWLRWLTEYREWVDPFEELFDEIRKPIPDWYLNR